MRAHVCPEAEVIQITARRLTSHAERDHKHNTTEQNYLVLNGSEDKTGRVSFLTAGTKQARPVGTKTVNVSPGPESY